MENSESLISRRPSYVIFDLGNVLVHIHPAAFLQSLGIDTPENRSYYQKRVVEIAKLYERGDDSTDQFFANLDGLFNGNRDTTRHDHGLTRAFTPDDFRTAMLSVIGQPVDGMEALVRRLAPKVPLGLLSNTNPIHFDLCRRTLPVLRYIPSYFLSYQLKAFKPDIRFFERVSEILKLNPGEILYIDDLMENVDSARAFGFTAYHFEGPEMLERRLNELQLI